MIRSILSKRQLLIAGALLMMVQTTTAQEQVPIEGAIASNVRLYSDPGGQSQPTTMSKSDFNASVAGSMGRVGDNRMIEIRIGGQTYWVKSHQVRVRRSVNIKGCGDKIGGGSAGGTRGAGGNC